MNNAQELKAHLQDSNKARMYEVRKIEKKAIREEILSILEDYHYESDTENMSKDVVVALENLVKSRLLSEVNDEHKKKEDELKTYMVEASHTQHASYEIKVKAKNKLEANKIALAKHIYDWSALDLVNEDGLSVDATEEVNDE